METTAGKHSAAYDALTSQPGSVTPANRESFLKEYESAKTLLSKELYRGWLADLESPQVQDFMDSLRKVNDNLPRDFIISSDHDDLRKAKQFDAEYGS